MRDLIYLDFEKAASIWSQSRGGLRERVSVTEETTKDREAKVKLGIPTLADAKFGADYGEKRSTLESRVLHHDLLSEVEAELERKGLVSDLLSPSPGNVLSPESIRARIGKRPYLRAEGPSVIEDYRRILSIAAKFNDIVDFVAWCGLENVRKSPEFALLQQRLKEARDGLKQIKDRNQKVAKQSELKALESQIQAQLKPELKGVEDRLLDGIRMWIETFMPNRINFRIYPYEACPSFQVVCNLKRECFVDQDLEHLLYGYSTRPNVPLAVFGLITSLPPVTAPAFDPLAELDSVKVPSNDVAVEKGFRGMFSAMDEFETLMRFSRYPSVTLHPIAVYRSFEI